jgi:hemerythrin superfamily protein
MDAITMLKADHKAVEQLFKRYEKAGDSAYVEKRQIVDRIIEALSKHAAVEEQLFYPVSRATVPDTDDVVLESLEEHHVVKWLLSELEGMPADHERFDAKVTVLIENVRHHVEEEESMLFDLLREHVKGTELDALGEQLEQAKATAPTRPRPFTPDQPPLQTLIAMPVAVLDRLITTGRKAVEDALHRGRAA